jgi:hypothetical protein
MLHPGFIKPERIANVDSEIQIVDTHKSLKTGFNIGFAAYMTQFNRTLLGSDRKKRSYFTTFAAASGSPGRHED